MTLNVIFLGRISFADSETIVNEYTYKRIHNTASDTLFLFEHPPTFTYHLEKDKTSIRDHTAFDRYITNTGALLMHAHDRGGGFMYHGPGQLIFAPVLRGRDIKEYQNLLQETMIQILERMFGICAFRITYNELLQCWMTEYGETLSLMDRAFHAHSEGVWVHHNETVKKIGFVGCRMYSAGDDQVISRGGALNLCPDLAAFRLIDPCNLPGVEAASVQLLRRLRPRVERKLAYSAAEIFCSLFTYDTYSFHDWSLTHDQ
ncbi:MAG: hypothetical protein U1A23_03070 [Candidatus Sungbacteria bacterium]|nr:hypothetical protein [bacterium]MDZ4285884.1 hypothetical protein [Candidatus Sungbacteria bacterium]